MGEKGLVIFPRYLKFLSVNQVVFIIIIINGQIHVLKRVATSISGMLYEC